jgi:hypothetical protein
MYVQSTFAYSSGDRHPKYALVVGEVVQQRVGFAFSSTIVEITTYLAAEASVDSARAESFHGFHYLLILVFAYEVPIRLYVP